MASKFNNIDFTGLEEYAETDRQRLSLATMIECGNLQDGYTKLGLDQSNFTRDLRIILKRAATHGVKPPMKDGSTSYQIPTGYSIKGESVLLDEDDNVKIRWVKTDRDKEEQLNEMLSFWEDYFQSNMPRAELTPCPKDLNENLLCDYTIGDAHIGMYAWAAETGENWDTEKGVDILRKASNHLVNGSPNAKYAYILDVGDFFHADNQSNETSHSGNKLDVDGRWKKVLEMGIYAIIDFIDIALQKHEIVYFRAVEGNHNEHTAKMLNIAIKLRFYDEPRLEVHDSPAIHNYFEFGTNLLADTHGEKTKPDTLPIIMANDVPQMWANTTNRVWRTGHIHSASQKDYVGCSVITYRTLKPNDYWHTGQYRSNRDMRMTIYHKDNGFIGMNVVNPSMLGY